MNKLLGRFNLKFPSLSLKLDSWSIDYSHTEGPFYKVFFSYFDDQRTGHHVRLPVTDPYQTMNRIGPGSIIITCGGSYGSRNGDYDCFCVAGRSGVRNCLLLWFGGFLYFWWKKYKESLIFPFIAVVIGFSGMSYSLLTLLRLVRSWVVT